MENTGRTLLVIVAAALCLQVAYHYATLGFLAGGDSHYPAPQELARDAGLPPKPQPRPTAPVPPPAAAPQPLAAVALVQPIRSPAVAKPPVKSSKPKPVRIARAGQAASPAPTPAPDLGAARVRDVAPPPALPTATATSAASQTAPY